MSRLCCVWKESDENTVKEVSRRSNSLKKSYKRNFPLTIRPRCTSGQAFETGRIVALCCKAGALGNFRER